MYYGKFVSLLLDLLMCLNSFGHLTTCVLISLQRIRELEDRLDLQKRQIKEIEEKVHVRLICVLSGPLVAEFST